MKGLSAVVARDAESVVAMEESIDAVRLYEGYVNALRISDLLRVRPAYRRNLLVLEKS